MGLCSCEVCEALEACCKRLMDAGYCSTSREAEALLKDVLHFTKYEPYFHSFLPQLRLLGGVHGATLYQVLRARKSSHGE